MYIYNVIYSLTKIYFFKIDFKDNGFNGRKTN